MSSTTFLTIVSTIVVIVAIYGDPGDPTLNIGGRFLNLAFVVVQAATAISNVELGADSLTPPPTDDNDPAEHEARLFVASITAVNALMLAAIAQKNADRMDRRMACTQRAFSGQTLLPVFYAQQCAYLVAAKGAKVAAHKRMMDVSELLVPEWAEHTGSVGSTDGAPGRLDDRLPPEIANVVRDWLQMCHEEMQDALHTI